MKHRFLAKERRLICVSSVAKNFEDEDDDDAQPLAGE